MCNSLISLKTLRFYIWLYLISCLNNNSTFAYPLTEYGLMQLCMTKNTAFDVENLENITYEHRAHCHEKVSSPHDKFENDFHIALKTLKIINQDNSSMVQISLTVSLPSVQENEGSFLFTFFWGASDDCHKFIIPFSSLSSVKKTFVLPCIQLPLKTQHVQKFFVNSYYKETKNSRYKIINVQASSYILKETSKMQVLKSVFRNFKLCFEQTHFQLASNIHAGDICPSIFNISIIESEESQTCDPHGQKIVCQWVSALKSSRLSLNCPRKRLKPSQTYCIHARLLAYEECKSTYLAAALQMTFFKIPYEVIPKCNFCEDWTASVHTWISTLEKKIYVQFKPDHEFANCFYSYIFRLFIIKQDEYGTGSKYKLLEMRINHSRKSSINYFTDVRQGNFSFLVIPCGKDDCHWHWALEYKIINTIKELDSTNSSKSLESTNSSNSQEFSLTVKIAMVLPLLVISLSIFCCLVKKCRSYKYMDESRRSNSQTSMYHKVQMVELESTSQTNSDQQMVYILHTLDQDTRNRVHNLRFVMEEIIRILKLRVIIKTIVEIATVDQYYEFFEWFSSLTNCQCEGKGPICPSNYKIVIVVSDRILHLLGGKTDMVPPVERKFLTVLKYIGNNRDRFANDCFHMFKVNFDSRFNKHLNYVASRGYDLYYEKLIVDFFTDLVKTSHAVSSRGYDLYYEKLIVDILTDLKKTSTI